MGPGIARDSQFDFLGTQVDYAPTILALANIPTPAYMDGTNLVPLLVSPETAAEQHQQLPRSVVRSLARTAFKQAASQLVGAQQHVRDPFADREFAPRLWTD